MPAVSRKQQAAIAIAEHSPNKLYKRNRGILSMTHQQMHDFAATPRNSLPLKAKKKKPALLSSVMKSSY